MRTTLTIPDDVLLAARQRAEANGQTIGDALADLARRGLEAEDRPAELEKCQFGFWRGVKFLPAQPDEPKVTLELVNKLKDDLE